LGKSVNIVLDNGFGYRIIHFIPSIGFINAKRSARQNLLDVVKYAKSAGCTDIEIHAASNCEKVFTGYGHHEDDM